MPSIAFINPLSGNAEPDTVKAMLADRLPELTLYDTSNADDLIGFMQDRIDSAKPDLVIASGGDGTVSATATALAGRPISLGVVPTGTANVLARELGISLELEEACDVIAAGHIRALDAMRVGTQRCLCRLGFGRVAEVGSDTSSEEKQSSQNLAYMRAAVPRLFAPEPLDLVLHVDGNRIEARSSSVVVTNINAIGMGSLQWSDAVKPDDGVVDVIVIDANDAADHLRLLWGAVVDGAAQVPIAHHLHARESIVVESTSELPVVADGEPRTGRSHRIEVCPGSVRICVPPPSSSG